MDVTEHGNGKLIRFSKPFDSRAKALFSAYALLLFTSASFFLHILLTFENPPVAVLILALIAIIAFYIGAYLFINKAVLSEKLLVTKGEVQLIQQGLFGSQVKTYYAARITKLRYRAKPELTHHPLAGQSFGYLGFQTGQQVIHEMHGDNRVAFDWAGTTVALDRRFPPGNSKSWNGCCTG